MSRISTLRAICALLITSLLSGCATEEGNDRLKVGLLLAAIGGIAYGAARSGGGGYSSPGADYDWDWDEFYNSDYQLVWACRGVQTGQFADASHCAYKYKADVRWPGK